MIMPIITSLTREVFDTTPTREKEAALALGATRWEMIRGAVFAHSKGGIVGAVMLGLGRAMGETIAVALVIGSNPQITAKLFAPGDSMPSVIANQFGESAGHWRAALIGLGVVLFVITILVNLAARGHRQPLDPEVAGRMTATIDAPPTAAPRRSTCQPEALRAQRAQRRSPPSLMGLSLVVVLVPLVFVLGHGDPEGRVGDLVGASSPTTSRPCGAQGPGMGPAIVGTLVITGDGHG